MPKIWHRIEEARTDNDMRVILEQEWAKNRGNLNVQLYDVFWIEDILTALRKVIFTKSARATYATSESCLSPLLLMPRSEEQRFEIEQDYQRRLAAGRNVTTADIRRAERAPRLPPLVWEALMTLLTTYALFFEMLFTARNAHLQGVNAVRRQLMTMANFKHCFDRWCCVNVM